MASLTVWQTLVRSFVTLLGGEAVARALGFIATIALARRLEPEGFGLITLGAALVMWLSLVVDAGTELSNVRDIARHPAQAKAILEPVLGLRLTLSVAAMAVFLPIAALVVRSSADRHVIWFFALVLPAVALNLRWMVLGVQGWKGVAAGNVASQLLFAVGVLVAVRSRQEISAVPILQTAGELIYGFVVWGALGRASGFLRPRLAPAAWVRTLRSALPVMAYSFTRTIVYFFGLFLIALVHGSRHAGLYGVAVRPVFFLAGALGLFSMSFLSSYSASDGEANRELFQRSVRTSLAIAVPIAFMLSGTAWIAVPRVYGKPFSEAALALAILAWLIPVLALTGPYGNVLIADHRQGRLLRDNGCAAVFNIAGNLLAVPLAGIAGAAAMTVITQVLVLVLNHRSSVSLRLAPPLLVVLARRPQPL